MHDLLSALQFLIASVAGRLQATLFNQMHPLPIAEEMAIFALWQVILITLVVYRHRFLRFIPWLKEHYTKHEASEQKATNGRFGNTHPRWQLVVFLFTLVPPVGLLTISLVVIWRWPPRWAIALFATGSTAVFLLYRYLGSYLPQPHLSFMQQLIGYSTLGGIYLGLRWRAKHTTTGTIDAPPSKAVPELPAQTLPIPLLEPLPQ